MALKWTMFYNQQQQGWTETYFTLDSNPQIALDGLTNAQLANFIGFRAPLTGLYGIRASDTVNPRNSYFRPLNNVFLNPSVPYPTEPNPDPASTDLVLHVYDGNARKKNVFLRGLRDADVQRDATGFRNISAPFDSAIKRWFNQASKLGFQLRSLQQPPGGGLSWQTVLSAQSSNLGNGFTELLLPAVPAWVNPGTFIRFQGVDTNALPGFPRQVQVTTTNAGQSNITIPVRWRNPAAVPTPKLKFTLITYIYTAWQSYTYGAFAEHKTGRPFGSQRGRGRVAVKSR